MKKRKGILSVAAVFVICSIIFGITYKPEKPNDSLTDIYEIQACIMEYMEDNEDSENKRISELIKTITSVGLSPREGCVVVSMKDCTFWKKNLFRKEIINSDQVYFEEGDYPVLQ